MTYDLSDQSPRETLVTLRAVEERLLEHIENLEELLAVSRTRERQLTGTLGYIFGALSASAAPGTEVHWDPNNRLTYEERAMLRKMLDRASVLLGEGTVIRDPEV